jgi:hypothetical protein
VLLTWIKAALEGHARRRKRVPVVPFARHSSFVTNNYELKPESHLQSRRHNLTPGSEHLAAGRGSGIGESVHAAADADARNRPPCLLSSDSCLAAIPSMGFSATEMLIHQIVAGKNHDVGHVIDQRSALVIPERVE